MKLLQKVYNSRVATLLSLIISRILLDYVYIKFITPGYSYRGLTYTYSIGRYILSWIVFAITIALIFWIEKRNYDESHKGAIIINILLCVSAVPTTTIIAYFDLSIFFSAFVVVYWVLVVFIYERRAKTVNKFTISLKQQKMVFYLLTALFAINLIVVLRYTGIQVNFNLLDVYDARSAFKTNQIPTIFRYLFFGSTMAFPVIVVYALKKKKYFLASIVIACQILAFFADGRKASLFILVLTVLGHFFIRSFNIRIIPFGSAAVIIAGCLEKWIFHSRLIVNFIVRRLYIIPAYLQYAYYDFFSSNEKDLLRQSIMGRIGFKSPYSIPIANVIGNEYYGGSYCNNGLMADGFANFGVIGVLLYPILVAVALRFLDKCSSNLSCGVCIGIIFAMSFAFLSSFFFAVLLTHGFLICCLVVYLMPLIKNDTL